MTYCTRVQRCASVIQDWVTFLGCKSVWLEDKEVHLHRFLWTDNPEDEIEVFVVIRVNISDKAASCIDQVAVRETANLPQFGRRAVGFGRR